MIHRLIWKYIHFSKYSGLKIPLSLADILPSPYECGRPFFRENFELGSRVSLLSIQPMVNWWFGARIWDSYDWGSYDFQVRPP